MDRNHTPSSISKNHLFIIKIKKKNIILLNGPTEMVCLDSLVKRRESLFSDTCRNPAYVTPFPPFSLFANNRAFPFHFVVLCGALTIISFTVAQQCSSQRPVIFRHVGKRFRQRHVIGATELWSPYIDSHPLYYNFCVVGWWARHVKAGLSTSLQPVAWCHCIGDTPCSDGQSHGFGWGRQFKITKTA